MHRYKVGDRVRRVVEPTPSGNPVGTEADVVGLEPVVGGVLVKYPGHVPTVGYEEGEFWMTRFTYPVDVQSPEAPAMNWTELRGEQARIYHYPDGAAFRVDNVVRFAAPRTTHRLETSDGRKFIPAPGWIGLEIIAEEWTA